MGEKIITIAALIVFIAVVRLMVIIGSDVYICGKQDGFAVYGMFKIICIKRDSIHPLRKSQEPNP